MFLLDNGHEIYVWVGRGATAAERRAGLEKGVQYIASGGRPSSTAVTKFVEGAQPAAFEALFAEWAGVRQPLLFGCSDESGTLEVVPICELAQKALEEEDAFILDAHTEVFVWQGSGASEEERTGALEAAKRHVAAKGALLGKPGYSLPITEVTPARAHFASSHE